MTQSRLYVDPRDWLSQSQRYKSRNDFAYGMAQRITQRINMLCDDRDHDATPGRNEIVLAKDAIFEAYLHGLDLDDPPPTRRKHVDPHSLLAGSNAGEDVGLGRPVDQGGATAIEDHRDG